MRPIKGVSLGATTGTRYFRLSCAALLWVGGSALFGWGFGLAFFADPAPWKAAACFALWAVSGLMVGGAARLAGVWVPRAE